MSTTSHNILITAKMVGFDTATNAVNNFAKSSTTATKGIDALGSSWNKASTGAVKFTKSTSTLEKGFVAVGKGATTAGKGANTYSTAAGKASTTTDKLSKGIGTGGRGLAFGFIGLGSAVAEAAGMISMYMDAAAKSSEAQARLNNLTAQGVTSGKAFSDATRDVAEAQRGLNFVLRNTILSVTDIATFVLLAVNALTQMRSISQSAAASTQALTTATQALNTAQAVSATSFNAVASAATAVYDSFGNVVARTTEAGQVFTNVDTTVRNMNTAFTEGVTAVDGLTTSGTNLVTGFTDLATEGDNLIPILSGSAGTGLLGSVTDLDDIMIKNEKTTRASRASFAGLATGIKALPGVFREMGSAVLGFFTNFGTNMTKLGGWLKTAGLAVAEFGKRMMIAFVTNPIGLAIVGITAATLALATNFGGVRDAVNSAGVAVGKAIPPLEGLLKAIGDSANAALDWIAKQLGMEQQANKTATALEQQAQVALKGTKEHINLAKTFTSMRTELEGVKSATYENTMAQNDLSNVTNTLRGYADELAKTYPQLGKELHKYLDETDASAKVTHDHKQEVADLQVKLTELENKYRAIIEGTTDKKVADIQAKDAATQHSEAEKQLSTTASNVTQYLSTQKDELGNLIVGYSDAVKTVGDYLIAQNDIIATTATLDDKQKKWVVSLLSIAPALDTIGVNLVRANDDSINWTATLDNMVRTEQELQAQTDATWKDFSTAIKRDGEPALLLVQQALKIIQKLDEELYNELIKRWEAMGEEFAKEGKYLDIFADTSKNTKDKVLSYNEEQVESYAELNTELGNQARWMGIWEEVAAHGVDTRRTIIDYTNEERDASKELVSEMQRMALARGMEGQDLKENTGYLLDYIQTHELAPPTIEEEDAALADLIDSRQQEAKATQLEEQALRTYISRLDESIDTTGMTADGMEDLLDVWEDTANATRIATDEVTLWVAELERNQVIEQEELRLLEELAASLGVEIPESIRGSIPDIKAWIEQITGMGDAAKKARDEALNAFNDLREQAKSAIADIISDKLGEDGDNIKKAIKGVKKIGLEIDNLNTKQAFIDVFLNDTDFKNDVDSLSEIIELEYGDIQTLTQEDAFAIGDTFAEGVRDAVGKKGQPIADTVDTVWEKVKASTKPTDTGEEIIGKLKKGLEQSGVVEKAIQDNVYDPILGKLGLIPPEALKTMKGVPENVKQALANAKPEVQNAILANFIDPATGEFKKIPTNAQTETAKVEGVFSTEFTKASAAATGIINKMMTTIMGDIILIKTTAENWLPLAVEEFKTFATDLGTQVGTINTTMTSIVTTIIGLNTAIGDNAEVWYAYFAGLTDVIAAFDDLWVAFIDTSMVAKLDELNTAIGTHSEKWYSFFTDLSEIIAVFDDLWVKFIDESMIAKIVLLEEALTGLYNTFIKIFDEMEKKVEEFAGTVEEQFGVVQEAGSTLQTAMTGLYNTWNTIMDEMVTKVDTFASACVTAFRQVADAAKEAETAVKDLQSAIDALKDKTITITVKYKTVGKPGARFGGATIGYARQGDMWIQDRPANIAGMNVSEGSKPELLTATPLSNPFDMLDKSINIQAPQIPAISLQQGGGGQGGQPFIFSGNFDITVQTQNGETLANEVKPFLLKGFGGIT